MKTLRPTQLKEVIARIIKDKTKIDLITGSLMISLAKFGRKNILNKEIFLILTESLKFGSDITIEEAKSILYATIGWFVCQEEKQIQLQILEVQEGSIKFEVQSVKS